MAPSTCRHLRGGLFGDLAQSRPGGRPFHVIALANRCLDAVRRRVQSEQTGHRDEETIRSFGSVGAPHRRREARRQSHRASVSLLELGDPDAEVAIAYRVKERLRDFYRTSDPDEARKVLDELQRHCVKRAMPPEIQKLGRTIKSWFDKICNFHLARVSNGRPKPSTT